MVGSARPIGKDVCFANRSTSPAEALMTSDFGALDQDCGGEDVVGSDAVEQRLNHKSV